MIRNVEAIYANGVLRPVERLPLRENERVRVSIDAVADDPAADREQAVRRFRQGAASSRLKTTGPLPSREQLHDRG